MSNVLKFDQSFDATFMSMDEIREEARRRGWYGIRIDGDEVKKTSRVIIRRISKREANARP